jgi:hypothetical protein
MLGNWQMIGGEDGRKITFSWHIKRDVFPLPAFDKYGPRQTAPRCLRPGFETSVPYGKAIPMRSDHPVVDNDRDDTPEEYPKLFDLSDLE